jgi:hypothetical protein
MNQVDPTVIHSGSLDKLATFSQSICTIPQPGNICTIVTEKKCTTLAMDGNRKMEL